MDTIADLPVPPKNILVALFPCLGQAYQVLAQLPSSCLAPSTSAEMTLLECAPLGSHGLLILGGPPAELEHAQQLSVSILKTNTNPHRMFAAQIYQEISPEILRAWYSLENTDLGSYSHIVVFESCDVVEQFSLANKISKELTAKVLDFRVHRSSEHICRLFLGTNSPEIFLRMATQPTNSTMSVVDATQTLQMFMR